MMTNKIFPCLDNPVCAGRPRKKQFAVNLVSHPSWHHGDVKAPVFNEDTFQLPKWAVLLNAVCTM